jgi:hypothetical protein
MRTRAPDGTGSGRAGLGLYTIVTGYTATRFYITTAQVRGPARPDREPSRQPAAAARDHDRGATIYRIR